MGLPRVVVSAATGRRPTVGVLRAPSRPSDARARALGDADPRRLVAPADGLDEAAPRPLVAPAEGRREDAAPRRLVALADGLDDAAPRRLVAWAPLPDRDEAAPRRLVALALPEALAAPRRVEVASGPTCGARRFTDVADAGRLRA